ncbi:MAG: YggS family pyridoxal phosphate-dependent enzyme [Christensenellaceae bacterium]|nr:YggS family pyridoxal phosphate-dependent enzyme [Christensenellaceae bacterium]
MSNLNSEILAQRLEKVKNDILSNCWDKNNPPSLVAVTKTVDANIINMLPPLGQIDIGENRAQSIVEKLPQIDKKINIHYIGRLQTNKIKYIINDICLVHSLDRPRLADELNKQALKSGLNIPVLVQVNIAQEAQKSGFEKNEAYSFIKKAKDYPALSIKGLMAMMPFIDDELQLATYFKAMRNMFDDIRQAAYPNVVMEHLSMGMTNDFKIAVSEGSTMVRVGSALFV